jgi:cobalt-zinc-cadmium efflux system membrane fusion protein
MQPIKLSYLSSAFVGLALAALTACSGQSPETAAAAASPVPLVAPASSGATKAATGDKGFAVSGPLIVEHQLDLLAQREGVVEKLHADVGARVSAGDLLLELDNRQLETDLDAARAKTQGTDAELKSWQSEAKVLQSDYDRAQKLWDAHLIPLEEYEHAKYKAEEEQWSVKRVEQGLANARASQHSLELELEKTRIRAPFSCVLARRYVREGQQVARGDRLFWITGDGPLRMRFTLPEKFIGRVKRGQELPLTTPDLPNQNYKSKVVEVSPVVDPSSSTFEVLVELQGPRGELRPGMDASVSLDNLQ